jgi:hypothetical protein
VAENVRVHRHLVNRDRPDAARADDQNLAQFNCSITLSARDARKRPYRELALQRKVRLSEARAGIKPEPWNALA